MSNELFIILFSIFGRRFGGTGKSGWNIFWIFSLIFNLFGYNGRYRGRHKRGQWTPYDGSSFSSDDDNRSDSFSGNGGSFGGGGASGGW